MQNPKLENILTNIGTNLCNLDIGNEFVDLKQKHDP